jgi:multisubunit Na+/H+ antiporter MnhG subunit
MSIRRKCFGSMNPLSIILGIFGVILFLWAIISFVFIHNFLTLLIFSIISSILFLLGMWLAEEL